MQAYLAKLVINVLAPSMRSPSGITGWITRSIMRKGNPLSTEYAINTRLNLKNDDVFVELGAGEGAGLKAVMQGVQSGGPVPSRIVLVEISEDFRRSLNEIVENESKIDKPKIEIHAEDCKSMPYLEDMSVDKMFAMNVVYFLDPLPEYLTEIHRVLKVGGSVMFCCKFKVLPQDNDVFVNTQESDIVQKMKDAGFDVTSEPMTVSETEPALNYVEVKGVRRS